MAARICKSPPTVMMAERVAGKPSLIVVTKELIKGRDLKELLEWKARPWKKKQIERIKEEVEIPTSTPWTLPFKLI
ncbi:hypothetical protein MKW98_004330 [Papaver atlanticum]|uniref:Uncharacterized protein n=1 Tax=Papaver atlanticum TaxID=357466 RepID=A0AAD4SPH4_9MAGN|nr:hypothetical protein MKW98_004330 [Papaver atlanticum]